MITVNGCIISNDVFGGNEFKCNFPDIFSFEATSYCQKSKISVVWRFDGNDEIIMLKFIKDHYSAKYPNLPIELTMYYIPYARMDRVKNDDDVFTLKYFADFVNSLKFSTIYVLDPHSDVSMALFNNVKKIDIKDIFSNIFYANDITAEKFMIVFPDYSAYKRYSEFFENFKMCFFEKKRNWETHKVEGMRINYNGIDDCGYLPDNILIVDDIISYGGTMCKCLDILTEIFPNTTSYYTYTTHTENVINKGSFYDKYLKTGIVKKHFTTNSIYNMTDECNNCIEALQL